MGTSDSTKNRALNIDLKEHLREAKLFPNTSAPWQQKVISEMLEQLDTGSVCLDAASGIGNNIQQLQNTFKEVYAIDRSASAIEFSKNRHDSPNQKNLYFSVGTLETLPYPDNLFDCVVCTEALEHVKDPTQVIKELRRVLKPSGYMILSFQNHFNASALVKFGYEKIMNKNWDAWGTHGHTEGYESYITVFNIKNILRKSELTIKKELGADYLNAWFSWIPGIYRNYALLDRYPLLFFGRIPLIKYLGMDFFIVAQNYE